MRTRRRLKGSICQVALSDAMLVAAYRMRPDLKKLLAKGESETAAEGAAEVSFEVG
jgi:hypothetical protein